MPPIHRVLLTATLVLVTATCLRAADEDAETLKLSDCPAPVRRTLKRESKGGTINEIVALKDESAKFFAAHLTLGPDEYQVLVAEGGMLVSKVLDDGEDHTEHEEDLDPEDCPPPVQKTLLREAGESQVEVVTRRIANGEAVYLADVELDRQLYEVMVSDDGTLISKTLLEDDDPMIGESETIEI